MKHQHRPATRVASGEATTAKRYSMEEAAAIYGAARHILTEARLEAMDQVRKRLFETLGKTEEDVVAELPAMFANRPHPSLSSLAAIRAQLIEETASCMAPMEVPEGTIGSIAELVGIDLEEFAAEAWEGFEANCIAALEGVTEHV